MLRSTVIKQDLCRRVIFEGQPCRLGTRCTYLCDEVQKMVNNKKAFGKDPKVVSNPNAD